MKARVSRLRRYSARCPFWARDGAPVWYSPRAGTRFAAVIDGWPWFAPHTAAWLVRLRDVETSAGTVKVGAELVSLLTPRVDPTNLERDR